MKKSYYLTIISVIIVIVLSLLSIVRYNSLLSEKSFYAIAGTQENYAWSIAKFAIQLNELYALTNNNSKLDDIRFKLDILYSRVNVLRNKSESTNPLYNQKGYQQSIDAIYKKLNIIDSLLSQNKPDLNKVIIEIQSIKPIAKELTNLADNAEVAQRTNALKDFEQKRNRLVQLLFITGFFALILGGLLIVYIVKINKILGGERAAISNKNAFLGMVGHELRTSLQALVSVIDSLKVDKSINISERHVNRLETAALKMERQMKDIAEFARIDNGSIEITSQYFKLDSFIRDVIQDCVDRYGNENVSIIVEDKHDLIISTDVLRLHQICENLISNALKYTSIGHVKISYEIEKGKWLRITVADTGKGMQKDKLKLIFKPFVRINNADHNVPGFGMGLAIVNGLIRLLRGSIQVHSETGMGTVITFRIPVRLGDSNDLPAIITSSFDKKIARGIHILVVDDNDLACSSLSELLSGVGYNVESTTSPERAYEKLLRKPYDLVLSDLQMPVLTGVELYQGVRSTDNPNIATPFIFISAFADVSPITTVPLLPKPARIDEINIKIQEVIGSKHTN
ncbi:hybrid sensor histidine kinase/response regulator [Enterobacter asburiae]|uniref:hybrid sensor histidine kinase/response regulator n=1 Tax=Enterobacter asburiae TaxID=61645 RepID=UPI003F43A0CD